MMNHSTMLLVLISLLLHLPHPSVSLLRIPTTASDQAEKLIRELNLFPKQPVNVVDPNKKLVEWPLRLPILSPEADGTSVENLAHHAGYYKIQNSYAAKSVFYHLSASKRFLD